MPMINFATREIHFRVIYYGPGLCGKTTNLRSLHKKTPADARGRLIELMTETDRTLFFDFMPLELGTIRGFRLRSHVYSTPGQFFYQASRALILRSADVVVFVADSQPSRSEANLESLEVRALVPWESRWARVGRSGQRPRTRPGVGGGDRLGVRVTGRHRSPRGISRVPVTELIQLADLVSGA